MKINLISFICIIIFLCACSAPKYLPTSETIDINEYGSYIRVAQYSGKWTNGELIAIDHTSLIIMDDRVKKCVKVPVQEIENYTLKYAYKKEPKYVLFTTIFHGFYLIFTAPANLLILKISENDAFTYNQKNLGYNELRMFARYPQGIPPNIELSGIK